MICRVKLLPRVCPSLTSIRLRHSAKLNPLSRGLPVAISSCVTFAASNQNDESTKFDLL